MLTEQIRLALGAGYTGLLNCKLTAAIVIEHVCVSYSLIGSEMCAIFLITGHLTGCAGADPHLSVKSASSEHFPHKNEKFAQH